MLIAVFNFVKIPEERTRELLLMARYFSRKILTHLVTSPPCQVQSICEPCHNKRLSRLILVGGFTFIVMTFYSKH